METFDNLAHQIVLLAIEPVGGGLRKRGRLGGATAAAALAELALQERLVAVDGMLRVQDQRPTDDPMVDVMLRDVINRPARTPARIVSDGRDAYLNQTLGELVSNRWVRLVPASGFRRDSYRVADTARLQAAQELAAAALHDPVSASDRAAFLAGLVGQIGLAGLVLPDLTARTAARQGFARRGWVNPAVQLVFAESVQPDRI